MGGSDPCSFYNNTNGSPSANSRDKKEPALDKSEGRSSDLTAVSP